jgi:hypothetical protein
MDPEHLPAATRLQRWTALGGLLAVVLVGPAVVGVFGTSALPWVLVVGGLLVTILGVGVAVRAVIARRFPASHFDLDGVSGPASRIEGAKARLARGDYAAFTVSAVLDPAESEASGQIWVYAARSGGIDKTCIELSYESSTKPAEHPALTRLLAEGWEVTRWEPDQWVLLTRLGDVSATEAVRLVAGTLGMLFDIPPSSQWIFRPFA